MAEEVPGGFGPSRIVSAYGMMIRTVLVWLTIVVATIILSLLALMVYPLDRSGRRGHALARGWAKAILWASGVKVEIDGLNHLQGRGPYIFMSNHQGAYDIFALASSLPFHFKWLAKKELFAIPILGQGMRLAGYIPIDREGTRETVKEMNEAATKIRNGMSVVLFPEGSRSEEGSLQPFKKGGFSLAIKSKVPIVPIAIRGSREVMAKGRWTVRPGRIRVRIGDPIETRTSTMKDRKGLMDQVYHAISKLFETVSSPGGNEGHG